MMDTGIKVLVVDDMSTMRRIIKNVLRQIGFSDIVEAENGQEALTKLKSGGFGLIVSDWNMPVMQGIELLRAVRGFLRREPHPRPACLQRCDGRRERRADPDPWRPQRQPASANC